MKRVLVADDDEELRSMLAELLAKMPVDVVCAVDGREAVDHVRAGNVDAVILDMKMPGFDGLEALPELKALAPNVPVIMLTAVNDARTAVRAMRLGAYDYITKPFASEEVVIQVRRALEWRALFLEVETLKKEVADSGVLRDLSGTSESIRGVLAQIKQVAGSTLSVLVEGETGTGKELVARAIHQYSARAQRPFIALDSGAIPETLIESELFGYERGAFTGADRRKPGHLQLADGGSLFLDEIVNLPLTTQAKLLRVLQERVVLPLGATRPVSIDVRLIAACNLELDAATRAGRFRDDLYYRLNEFKIVVPPLRARRDDILPLARRFIAEASMELKRPVRGLSDEAAARLSHYAWPGNVRQLRSVMRRAVLLSDNLIEVKHLHLDEPGSRAPGDLEGPPSVLPTLREAREGAMADAERQAIRWALEVSKGNKSEAARRLQTDYKTLLLKIKQYAIRPGF